MKTSKRIIALILSLILALCAFTTAFAAEKKAEEEPNNEAAQATVFTFGESASGNLEGISDVDWFKFDVAKSGFASVTFAHAAQGTDSVYFTVTVADKDLKEIESFSVKGDAASTVSPDFQVSEGSYYVKVAAGSTVAAYDYTVTAAAVNIDGKLEEEPNDSTSQANKVDPVTTEIVGTDKHYGILAQGDTDYYYLTAPTGYISLNLKSAENAQGSFSFKIIQKLADKEYVISETVLPAGGSGWVYGSAVGVKQGVYYVSVSGAKGGYYFEVYSKAGAANEAEYNNTAATANSVLSGKTLWASMNNAADIDCFTVKTTDDDSIKVTLAAGKDSGEEIWTVAIENSAGNELYTAKLTASQKAEYSFDKDGAGDYYIYVKSSSGYSGNDYSISAERIDPVKPEEHLSVWDRIKAMDWGSFWNSNFSFVEMINFLPVIYDLFRTSIGTIIKILSR